MSFRSIEQSIGWRNSLWGSFYAKNKSWVEAKNGGVREEIRDDDGSVVVVVAADEKNEEERDGVDGGKV